MIGTTSIRTANAPPPWLVAQRWERLLFAHWSIDPAKLRAVLPPRVEPDVHEGSAWLAIVAFLMVGTRSCGPPWWPVLAPIPELNVRTYVRVHDVPAVWFLSLDASSTFFATIGRKLYGMRYHVAQMRVSEDDGGVRFRSARRGAAFAATYAPAGPVAKAEPGSLEHFLVERYRLFAERRGRLITAQVAHEPWPLQPAVAHIEVNEMAPPNLEFNGEPLLHFCRSVAATISAPAPARLERRAKLTSQWQSDELEEKLLTQAAGRPPRDVELNELQEGYLKAKDTLRRDGVPAGMP